MSYDARKKESGRRHAWRVKITMPQCGRTHGVSPCTATETGQDKCYNTLGSCNDIANYSDVFGSFTNEYHFYSSDVGMVIDGGGSSIYGGYPSVESVSITPSKIDLKGGLGVRSKATVVFNDHPSLDDEDFYPADRTLIAAENGSFWTKFRAKYPNYQNVTISLESIWLGDNNSISGLYGAGSVVRTFITDSLEVSNGKAKITAKDPLKLASSKKALAPALSTGELSATLLAGATSATLTPSGIGNSEYAASGKVAINKEVMSFTRSGDVLTLTRAENNTKGVEHASGDTVQECLEYNDQVNVIVEDLLTTYAGIDSAYISTVSWQSEVDTYLSGLLDGIITKPTDVNKLLKELAESAPHYLWWDEVSQLIILTALKPPPTTANQLNMDSHLIADQVYIKDNPSMRVSSVYVNYGQFDPTIKLDESRNFQRALIRVDQDSINQYGSNEVMQINSRWISDTNKAAALQLAALYGRRFADIPRSINFKLDPKDSDVWTGQVKAINHRDIVDPSGLPVDTLFQITSASQGDLYSYEGLEFVYGAELTEDEGGGDPDVDLVIVSGDENNLDLRARYNTLYPAPDATTQAKFIIENSVVVGSSLTTTNAIETGAWPAGATVELINNGHIVGAGGKGQHATGTPAATAGGLALLLEFALTLVNNGVIGGGGGGGGRDNATSGSQSAECDGGGGAGQIAGEKGSGYNYTVDSVSPNARIADSGSLESGGRGAILITGEITATADSGGDLGQAGGSAGTGTGAAAGDAIDKNGFVLTETLLGDVRGSVLT